MSGAFAIDKPTVFLSHAATDEPIVRVLHAEINRTFAHGVDVFATSVPGQLAPGSDWLANVNEKLRAARAVIVLLTPVSLNRPWIWFEVGASWAKMEGGDGRIFPLCVPEVDKASLPEPLSRLQAMSLGKAAETRLVFQELVDLFGFGTMKGFRHASIRAKLPRYADLSVAESDLASGDVYNGPYEGYSDDELGEVIDEYFCGPAWADVHSGFLPRNEEFRGALIHFREVDERLQLPRGTSARLLEKRALDHYWIKTLQRTENTVRFVFDKAAFNAAHPT